MPESLVTWQGSLNPQVALSRWLLSVHLTQLLNGRLSDIINRIEFNLGNSDFTPLRTSAAVTYMARHSRFSRNAARIVVEAMPGDDGGRRGSIFLRVLRRQLELLFDEDKASHPAYYRAAGVEGIEVNVWYKNATGSTVAGGKRQRPWGDPTA